MARASHRLRLCVLARDPDAPEGRLRAAWDHLVALGWLEAHLSDAQVAGPGPRPLVDGGFTRATLQRAGTQRFLANGSGGFHVRCAACTAPLAAAFSRALAAWRGGGPRQVACACGHAGDLSDVAFAPAAGFAWAWIALEDVASAALCPEAEAALEGVLGGMRLVGQRG